MSGQKKQNFNKHFSHQIRTVSQKSKQAAVHSCLLYVLKLIERYTVEKEKNQISTTMKNYFYRYFGLSLYLKQVDDLSMLVSTFIYL